MPQLDGSLEFLQDLKTSLQTSSCLPKEPFMKLGTGAAPTLNYNIPQESCFSTYGNIQIEIASSSFKGYVSEPPQDNFFDTVAVLSTDAIEQRIREDVQFMPAGDTLVANNMSLRTNLNTSLTNLSAVGAPIVDSGDGGGPIRGGAVGIDGGVVNANESLIYAADSLYNEKQLASKIADGYRPFIVDTFGDYGTRVAFLPRPVQPQGRIYVIEEYRTCSYLGDYGAGKTISTFSLLPGEKTTISIRTYRESTETRTRSENLLDSFSESASNEMERLLEKEFGYSASDGSTTTNNVGASVSASASGSFLGISASGSASANYSRSKTKTAARAANVRGLNRALSKHATVSNSTRNIEVNSTSTATFTEGEEQSVVRELENFNKSRVLNFVFRQLLQEYVSVTYLSNIKIAFCNGYTETLQVVDIEDIDSLLDAVIEPNQKTDVRTAILKDYCKVMNHEDDMIDFIEMVTVNNGECLGAPHTETFWRRRKSVDTYSSGGLDLTVNGVILSVQKNTLRTDSVVADAVLGQGEALDCFNQKLQDAAAIAEQIKNLEEVQKMAIIEAITDPVQRVELYKRVFGACCDVPQTQIIS